MNDWYNNPPDDRPEVDCPKCKEPADFVRTEKTGTVFACTACGHEFFESYPEEFLSPETEPTPFDEPLVLVAPEEEMTVCRHGQPVCDCNACMVESDFAYDAARERM